MPKPRAANAAASVRPEDEAPDAPEDPEDLKQIERIFGVDPRFRVMTLPACGLQSGICAGLLAHGIPSSEVRRGQAAFTDALS